LKWSAGIGVALAAVISCSETPERVRSGSLSPAPSISEGVMSKRFSDPAFEGVIPGSLLSYPCSPVIDDFDVDFRGILLNAPKEVYLDAVAQGPPPVVVCGTYAFDWNYLDLEGEFLESISLVVVDEDTNESRSAAMQTMQNPSVKPRMLEQEGLDPSDFEGRVIEKHFNPDLGELLDLPRKPATYVIYATLGTYKSNVVRVRVVNRSK
jgi:hypothetical protein